MDKPLKSIQPEEEKELFRLRELSQQQAQAKVDADRQLRSYVFRVMEQNDMLNNIEDVKDMIRALPSGYTRFVLCGHYLDLGKKQSPSHSPQSDGLHVPEDPGAQARRREKIGPAAEDELQRLCRLCADSGHASAAAAAELDEYARTLITEKSLWDDPQALEELLHYIPTGELLFEVLEAERQGPAAPPGQLVCNGEGGMALG